MLGALGAGALQLLQLAPGGGPHVLGGTRLLQAQPVVGDHVVVALAQLRADGLHLAAQDSFTLGLVDALGHAPVDLGAHGHVGQHVLGPGQHLLQAGLDVDGLEHLDLLLQAQLGQVQGGVGHGTGIGDPPQALGQAAGTPVLEDGLDDGPVLAGQLPASLTHRRPAGLGLPHRLGRDPQAVTVAADTGADGRSLQAPHHDGAVATGQPAHVFDLGHGAHPGVVAVQLGHQQQPARVALRRLDRRTGLGGLQHDVDDHGGTDRRRWPLVSGEGLGVRHACCNDEGLGVRHTCCNDDYRSTIPPGGPTTLATPSTYGYRWMALVSRNSSRPAAPSSRPLPDCL